MWFSFDPTGIGFSSSRPQASEVQIRPPWHAYEFRSWCWKQNPRFCLLCTPLVPRKKRCITSNYFVVEILNISFHLVATQPHSRENTGPNYRPQVGQCPDPRQRQISQARSRWSRLSSKGGNSGRWVRLTQRILPGAGIFSNSMSCCVHVVPSASIPIA